MIKINLLPVKRKKKPKPVPTFLTVGAILLVVVVAVSVSYSFILNSRIDSLKQQKEANAKKLAALNEKIKEVKDFEKLNERFKQRKAIIEQLTKNQSVPVKVLDEMSRRLTEGVWLRTMAIAGDNINLNGMGFTNSDIVGFVQSLKESGLFTDVHLHETRQTGQQGVEVYQFKITLKVKV